MALPPGYFYVCKGDRYVWDEPPARVASPATETDWRVALPSVSLAPVTVKLLEMLQEGMADLPVEYFLSLGIGPSGEACFEEWQSDGQYDHASVDYHHIVRRAKESGAVAVFCAHNHPDANPRLSEGDERTKRQLERVLAAEQMLLFDFVVVPANPERLQESCPLLTSYDRREAEGQRLWAAYDGVPSWQTWQRRLPEAALFPRDVSDVDTMINLMLQAAGNILHAADLNTKRLVLRRVAQQIGAA